MSFDRIPVMGRFDLRRHWRCSFNAQVLARDRRGGVSAITSHQYPAKSADAAISAQRVNARWHFRPLILKLGLSALWMVLWSIGLGERSLGEPDEARYAEVAREMLVSGDWLTPRLDGFHFFDKPVLQYWATAVFYAMGGIHPWTARLWPSLTAFLAVLAASWASRRLHGARVGCTTAMILGGSLLFYAGGRINTMDMGVAAFLSIAMSLFVVAQFDAKARPFRHRLQLGGWLAIALAVLSKGLIGLVFPVLALSVFMIWERSARILRELSIAQGLAVVVVIAAPWFVLISLRHPEFFHHFFIKEHFSRFLTNADDRNHAPWFFAVVVLLGFFPWIVFLPISPAGWRSLIGIGRAERFLLGWSIVIFVFFSLSRSKLPFYILPIFPALAMLVAVRIATLSIHSLRWRFAGIAVLAAVVAPILANRHDGVRHLSQHIALHPLFSAAALALGLLATAAAMGLVALFFYKRQMAVTLLGFAALLACCLLFARANVIGDDLSALPAAQLMRPLLRPGSEIFTVHAYQRGLSFYLQRLVVIADETPADIDPGRASRPDGFLPDLHAFEQRWAQAPDAMALVNPRLIPQLRLDQAQFTIIGSVPVGTVIKK